MTTFENLQTFFFIISALFAIFEAKVAEMAQKLLYM
jgi:hypothetical protein